MPSPCHAAEVGSLQPSSRPRSLSVYWDAAYVSAKQHNLETSIPVGTPSCCRSSASMTGNLKLGSGTVLNCTTTARWIQQNLAIVRQVRFPLPLRNQVLSGKAFVPRGVFRSPVTFCMGLCDSVHLRPTATECSARFFPVEPDGLHLRYGEAGVLQLPWAGFALIPTA